MRKWLGGVMASLLLFVSPGVSSQAVVDRAATNQELLPFATQDNTGKHWGYLNQQGKVVIKPAYDSAEAFNKEGLAIVSVVSGESAAYGVINESGTFVIPAVYDQLVSFGDQLFEASRGEATTLLDRQGNAVVSFEKSSISHLAEGLAAFTQNGLYGYLDHTGKVAIKPAYKSADEFKDGVALVVLTSGHYATINKKGEIVQQWPWMEEQMDVYNLQDGIAPYYDENTSKYGYVDVNGKIVIPAKFREATAFYHGVAAVDTNDEGYEAKMGLMNRQGEFVVKPAYSVISYLNNGLWAVGKGNGNSDIPDRFTSHYALVDQSGKFLTEMVYDTILPFEGDYAVAQSGLSTFFMDRKGKKVTTLPTFKGVGSATIKGDIIEAEIDERTSYVRLDGTVIWQEQLKQELRPGVTITEEKFHPNRNYLEYYPVISGLADKAVEQKINQLLKANPADKEADYEWKEDTYDFSIASFTNDLLILHLSGYSYPLGAAHGMPYSEYQHIDLKTGKFYELSDLFKSGSGYKQ